jgi:hypothetical protein
MQWPLARQRVYRHVSASDKSEGIGSGHPADGLAQNNVASWAAVFHYHAGHSFHAGDYNRQDRSCLTFCGLSS